MGAYRGLLIAVLNIFKSPALRDDDEEEGMDIAGVNLQVHIMLLSPSNSPDAVIIMLP